MDDDEDLFSMLDSINQAATRPGQDGRQYGEWTMQQPRQHRVGDPAYAPQYSREADLFAPDLQYRQTPSHQTRDSTQYDRADQRNSSSGLFMSPAQPHQGEWSQWTARAL